MNEREARRIVRLRSGGVCEVCGGERATNFQHRKNRSQGGLWLASNGLDVCGSGTWGCHGRIHARPQEAYRNGWSVKSWADPALVPFLHHTLGRMYLDDLGDYHYQPAREVA